MIVSIANQKGGVGKTTTAINLAAALALRGKPTLLIDLDPQGNSSLTFIDPRTLTKNVFDAFVEPNCTLKDIIVPTAHPHLFLAPARISWPSSSQAGGGAGRALPPEGPARGSGDEFEYVVIDCPPTLGLLTVNALVASSHLLIPIQSSYFALEGTDDLLETVDEVRARANPARQIVGVVITMHDRRTALGKDIKKQIHKVFGTKVFKTLISKSVRLEESPAYKESIFSFAPDSSGATEYYSLSEEVIERV